MSGKRPENKKNEALVVISWKARQLGTTYGKLYPRMKEGDLEKFTKEYEEAEALERQRLRAEANDRKGSITITKGDWVWKNRKTSS